MKDEEPINLEKLAIGTLPVGCLTAASFRIPKYQRGYRWKKDDVEKLLKDLKEFLDGGDKSRPFYCLQPLVVKKSKDHSSEWEVVDGQQRLTTLFLIWKELNHEPPYELSYDTRELSKDFLNGPTAGVDGKKQPNIDFHHIYHAHQKIHDWFTTCCGCMKEKFRTLLADTDTEGRNVRIIWYKLQAEDDAVAAFTRLNVGKIPLTDEELIRALFLRSQKPGELADGAFQHRMALEWDRIETALQEPDFWGFISNQDPPEGGRIRLLFQLCAPAETKDDNHALFDHYQKRLDGERREEPSKVWHDIVAYYEQLEEWYRDPELFHLVGYVTTIQSAKTLRELVQMAQSKTKIEFSAELRTLIRKALVGDGKKLITFIDELDYHQNPGPIRPTLALFNIATVLRTNGISLRFPFHHYHGIEWDIEHVHSQAGQDLSNAKHQQDWLPDCVDEIRMEDPENALIQSIKAFITKQPDAPTFENILKKITEFFGEPENAESSQDIGNLTLLDAHTNRGYGNAPFVVKRAQILKAERKGTFILPCTRDLFLKVFSKKAGNLRRWDIKNDGAAHKAAICETLETFFGEK